MKNKELLSVPLRMVFVTVLAIQPHLAQADTQERIFVVRERASASLLDGAFEFKVLKLRGYTIEIKAFGEKRSLKIGESFSSKDMECTVTFKEIATETRLARFATDCL